jgi:hypothetical protein
MRRQLISHATSILVGFNANIAAVKCLLAAGKLEDAIAVCSYKKIRPQKEDDFILASHFFQATIEKAGAMESVGEKCKLFYHLYFFLNQTFSDAFQVESRKIKITRRSSSGRRASFTGEEETVSIEQSKLAHGCKFPDDMFGGNSSALCLKLRGMYGYFNSVK